MLKRSNLGKYVRMYAEPEAAVVPPLGKAYGSAIVVPACGETSAFLNVWSEALRVSENLPLLVVVVVNGDSQTAAEYACANRHLVEGLLSRPHTQLGQAASIYLLDYGSFDVLLIDRSSAPHLLPAKCGVGLARKIGADVVCAWQQRGTIVSPWFLSTDADVELPSDIGKRLGSLPAAEGIVCLPFEHVAGDDERVTNATLTVEIELRYHALGLGYAGSNYAWPALGSCLAIHIDTYASVRGFPKRQAGEDHYLLQKAVKLGPVSFASGQPLKIRARSSARTPFGTGRSVAELLNNDMLAPMLRHPECYTWLGRVITRLDVLGETGSWLGFEQWLEQLPAAIPVASVLLRIGALDAWRDTCARKLEPRTRTRCVHEWFDGLRQIQFLRGLQGTLQPLAVAQALALAPFTPMCAIEPLPISDNGENTWWTTVRRLRGLEVRPQRRAR